MLEYLKISVAIETITKLLQWIKGIFCPKPFKKRSDVFRKLNHSVGKPSGYCEVSGDNSAFGVLNFPSVYKLDHSSKPNTSRKVPINIRKIDDFFSKALCDFTFTVNSNVFSDNNERGEKHYTNASVKAIVDDYIFKLLNNTDPQTVVIDGKIGCGKSTLLAALMREMQGRSITSIKYLPIKIDLREDFENILSGIIGGNYKNESDFIDSINEHLLACLSKKIKIGGVKLKGSEGSISALLTACYRQTFSPIIMIDELDTIYYDFCCASLDPYSGIVQSDLNNRYLSIMTNFLQLAETECISGPLSFNTLIFISARTSTLKLLEDMKDTLLSPHKKTPIVNHRVTLQPADNHKINTIILRRLEFSKGLAEKTDISSNATYIANMERTIQALHKNEIDYSKNLKISVHGIRHLMKILSLIDEHDPNGELIAFLLLNPDLLRIYQYIDGCVDYSQTIEGVSNIYLVNRDFKLKQHRDRQEDIKSVPKSLLVDHLQTYWLKYFMIKHAVTQSKKRVLTAPELIDTFCKSNDDQSHLHYEKELAHLIILHATEVIHGRLLKLGANASKSDASIIPSSRAIEFVDRNLFWEFSYLFVVIEDEWLGIPESMYSDFIITEQWQRTYHFITNYHNLGDSDKYRFVKYKALLVLKFVTLLEASLDNEMKRCSVTYDKLKSQFDGSLINSVNMKDNISAVKNSIIKFTESYVSDNYKTSISDEITTFINNGHKPLLNEIKKNYKKYYNSGFTITGINEKMDMYHKNRPTKI